MLAAPTLGADPIRYRWVVPLRAAAVAAGVALLASALLSPPLLLLARARWRSRDPRRSGGAGAARWSAPGSPTLEVRGLTKIYSSGVTALPP